MTEPVIITIEKNKQIFPHQNNGQKEQIQPDERTEQIILNKIEQLQIKQGKNIISEDIHLKLRLVMENIKNNYHKHFQTIITLRMQELAYNKILVQTYKKSYFRQVQALYHIAKEYIKFQCFDHALKHLEQAKITHHQKLEQAEKLKQLKKAEKAGKEQKTYKAEKAYKTYKAEKKEKEEKEEKIKKAEKAEKAEKVDEQQLVYSLNKLYHSFILTALAQCRFKCMNFKEALKQLTQALKLQKKYQQDNKKIINNLKTLTLLAKVKQSLKHKDSIQKISQAVGKANQLKKQHSRAYGLILYQQATFLRNRGKNKEAIQYYQNAIQIIKLSLQPEFETDIIKIYNQLADLYKKDQLAEQQKNNNQNNNKEDNYISTLKSIYQFHEQTYGYSDSKSIKQQKTLATALLQKKCFDDSLQQFDDILEKQIIIYGEDSLQVGKQYNTIGSIYFDKNDTKTAEKYYKKSMQIFKDLGKLRLAKMIQRKICFLQSKTN